MTETTILVVDDIADVRAITVFELRRAGYAVIEAETGTEALDVAARLRPDLIVLDIRLPDIDGFEVCRRLRTDPVTARIPILQLSAAYRGSRDRARALDLGSDAYLTQPVDPDELVATARALLRMHRAERELSTTQACYRRLIDTALEGVWSLDAAWRTAYANAQMAAMLQHTVDEMLGRSLFDFIDAAARDETERAFEQRRHGVRDQRDVRFRRKDGSAFCAMVATIPIVADDGASEGLLALVTDITDRRRAERAEQWADTLRSVASLANAAAHEINNPLTVIVGTLQLLERDANLDLVSHVRIERALQASRAVHAIVRRMARISHLEEVDQPPGLPMMLDLRRSSPDEADPGA